MQLPQSPYRRVNQRIQEAREQSPLKSCRSRLAVSRNSGHLRLKGQIFSVWDFLGPRRSHSRNMLHREALAGKQQQALSLSTYDRLGIYKCWFRKIGSMEIGDYNSILSLNWIPLSAVCCYPCIERSVRGANNARLLQKPFSIRKTFSIWVARKWRVWTIYLNRLRFWLSGWGFFRWYLGLGMMMTRLS